MKNQAVLDSDPQQSVVTVTPEKKVAGLDDPHIPTKEHSYTLQSYIATYSPHRVFHQESNQHMTSALINFKTTF